MFLDDAGAESHRSDSGYGADRVIREPGYDVEGLRQLRDVREAHLAGFGGISAVRVEKRQLSCTSVSQGPHGLVDLRELCHPRRSDHRLLRLCDVLEERNVDQLER